MKGSLKENYSDKFIRKTIRIQHGMALGSRTLKNKWKFVVRQGIKYFLTANEVHQLIDHRASCSDGAC